MRQITIYFLLGAALVAAVAGWQFYDSRDEGAPAINKYDALNEPPAAYRELVSRAAAALPAIGPDAALEFPAPPERDLNARPAPDSAPVRWIGKVVVSAINTPPAEWIYVIENGEATLLKPSSQ